MGFIKKGLVANSAKRIIRGGRCPLQWTPTGRCTELQHHEPAAFTEAIMTHCLYINCGG